MLPDLTREDFLAMLRSPDSPEQLEWKISPTGIVDADADTGVVTAIVAVTGIVDEVDDIIVPGAFTETLQRRVPKGVWSHDVHTWVSRTDAIGELMPGDSRLPAEWKGRPWPADAGALVVKTAFNLGTTAGKDAYSNVVFFDAGPLGPQVEWSIGYNSIPGFTRRNQQGQRELKKIDLYEYGPVLFGAMPLAGTVGTKARIDALEHKGVRMGDTASTVIGNLELKVAGKEASPKDVKNTERLKAYWEHGEGAAKIQWGTPGDFDRCVTELSKYMPPQQVKGYCANRHKGATGGWPGHAPGVEQAEADAKKAEKKADPTAEDQAAAMLDRLEGKATTMPGTDSFPIDSHQDVKDAVRSIGRAKNPGKAKRWIKKRAKALGASHLIPDKWTDSKDAAVDTLDSDTDTDDGGLAEAVAELRAYQAIGMSDAEIDAALAGEPEWTSLPDDLGPAVEQGDEGFDEPPGGGDASQGGDEEPPAESIEDELGIGGEHKTAKVVTALEPGDRVIELKGVAGAGTLSGTVRATSARGPLIGVAIETKSGLRTAWVPNTTTAQVHHDPYREVKDALRLVVERKDYPYLPGSVEERQSEIREAVNDLLLPEPDAQGIRHAYVSLDATFADYVVATLNDYSMPGSEEQAFAIPYTVGDDGDVDLGQPIPVEKQVVLVPDNDYAEDQAEQQAAGVPTPDVQGGQAVPTMTPIGGMNPAINLARKIAAQAKALIDDLEAKAAAGTTDLSGTHVRRLRAADEALTGALAGLGSATVVAAPDEGKMLGEVAELLTRIGDI